MLFIFVKHELLILVYTYEIVTMQILFICSKISRTTIDYIFVYNIGKKKMAIFFYCNLIEIVIFKKKKSKNIIYTFFFDHFQYLIRTFCLNRILGTYRNYATLLRNSLSMWYLKKKNGANIMRYYYSVRLRNCRVRLFEHAAVVVFGRTNSITPNACSSGYNLKHENVNLKKKERKKKERYLTVVKIINFSRVASQTKRIIHFLQEHVSVLEIR